MNLLAAIQVTAGLSASLFRNAFPIYAMLYDCYKRVSERGEIALIRRLVRRGDHVVDVGANIGFYTELLAQCVGPEGRVDAFEPDEMNFRRLSTRAKPYSQIRPVRAAVTERSGTVSLHLSPQLNVDHRTYPTDEARSTVTVDAVALDDIYRGEGEQLQFIKLDIQGAEYAALLGMRQVVSRSPSVHLLMEVWPSVLDRFGVGTPALLSLLASWGLEMRVVGADGGLGEHLTADTLARRGEGGAYFSVLCYR